MAHEPGRNPLLNSEPIEPGSTEKGFSMPSRKDTGSIEDDKSSQASFLCQHMKRGIVVVSCAYFMVCAALLTSYIKQTGTEALLYRLVTTTRAAHTLITMPKKDVTAFVDSYEIFEKEVINQEDEAKIVDYYNVMNHLCAVGEVEKMYIPPFLDMNRGIYGNQILSEIRTVELLGIKKGDRVLELGCGRGRISQHTASITGAKVVGMNIDQSQITNALAFAKASNMEDQLEFHVQSFNTYPFPFEDESFDAFYHVQALTYATDLDRLFKELNRLLKPGAKASFLDYFLLDAYDETREDHRKLLKRVKALLGGVYSPRPTEYHALLEKNGFRILYSGEPSIAGHQYPMIEKARDYFMPIGTIVNTACNWGLLPQHTATLLNRLNLYVDEFVRSDREGLLTTSYQIIAEKIKNA